VINNVKSKTKLLQGVRLHLVSGMIPQGAHLMKYCSAVWRQYSDGNEVIYLIEKIITHRTLVFANGFDDRTNSYST